MRLLVAIACLLGASPQALRADESQPQSSVRVWVQFIALSHETLTDLLAQEDIGGAALHRKLMTLRKSGQSEIIETTMVSALNAERASVESIREEIYPTEYDPPEMAHGGGSSGGYWPRKRVDIPLEVSNSIRGINATAFETRNTGITLEIEPTLRKDGYINLRLVPEIVHRLREVNWFRCEDAWGEVTTRFPIYESWRSNHGFTAKAGSFCLLSSITPKRDLKLGFDDPRILIFLRADIISPEP